VSEDSYWGDLSEIVPEESPFLLLQRQADLLKNATSGLLEGKARRRFSSIGRPIEASMEVVASALQNYSFEILRLSYDASRIYPVVIRDFYSGTVTRVSSEDEFKEELQAILSSKEVRTVLANLISESQLSVKE